MASLTIEELKAALIQHGIDLPAGRLKKDDYVKLYEENVVLNGSSAAGFSDDENTQNSRKVSSTNELDSQIVEDAVGSFSNEELFEKLREMGYSPGPILPNTRKVYENKFLQLLRRGATNGTNNGYEVDSVELSDNEADIRPSLDGERKTAPPLPQRGESREPSSARDPPPPSVPVVRETSVPRRFTYIEKIPRGSSQRIFEPISSFSIEDSLRQRPLNISEGYKGRWSPSNTLQAANLKSVAPPSVPQGNTLNLVILVVGLALLVALAGFVYSHWSAIDPYNQIEQDAEKATIHHKSDY